MTMDNDQLEKTAEGAAHLVKLTSSDWKRLALILLVVLIAVGTAAFNLAEYSVKGATQRLREQQEAQEAAVKLVATTVKTVDDNLKAVDTRLTRAELIQADNVVIKGDIKEMGSRISKIEAAQSDVAVIKNDVAWIKQYLDEQRKLNSYRGGGNGSNGNP